MALTSPHDTSVDQVYPVSDLDRLWDTEFGDGTEMVIRVFGIAAGGLALWMYDGALLGPLWAGIYLTSLLINYLLLRPRSDGQERATLACYVTFMTSLTAYLSLPIYLVLTSDPLKISCGAMALIAYAVFTLYRPAPPGVLAHLDIAIAWLLAAVAAIALFPIATSLVPQIAMIALCVIMAVYYSMTVRQMRAAQAEFRKAAQRSLEAQKMEAIGRLSGGIAHDFNNILTVMQGSLELYHEVPKGAERDALVDEARSAGVRATALVAQLLAFARRAPLEARAQDANAVVDELCTLARRLLPVSVQLDHRMTEDQACVLADSSGLHSALLNLILNANDAMDGRGSITIAVDLLQGPAHEASTKPAASAIGGHLCFSVADDGPGMPPEVERRATEPFFTTKAVGKGSGLGLSMAVGFAEQSGGALRIKTSQAGTTVAVHLPLAQAPVEDRTAT